MIALNLAFSTPPTPPEPRRDRTSAIIVPRSRQSDARGSSLHRDADAATGGEHVAAAGGTAGLKGPRAPSGGAKA